MALGRPVVVLLGPQGSGKSTAVIQACSSFMEQVLYIQNEPNASASWMNPRWNPGRQAPKLITYLAPDGVHDNLLHAVSQAERGAAGGHIKAAVLDTLSTHADKRIREILRKNPQLRSNGRAWDQLSNELMWLVDRLVATQLAVFLIGHEHQPEWKQRGENGPRYFVPGGIDVPGQQLGKRLNRLCDVVCRVKLEPGADGRNRRVLARDELDTDWPTKDRWDVITNGMELNLEAVCRAIVQRQREAGVT